MRYLITIFFLTIANFYAQSGKISGKLIQKNTQEPIPFATVSYSGASSGAVITDEDGGFQIEKLKFGTYTVTFSFIGFQDEVKEYVVSSTNKLIDETVELTEDIQALQQVEIVANKKTVATKIDRKIYNAADFETAKGGTAVDVLSRLPGLNVGNDGKVSLRGTEDFTVYLNGKPTTVSAETLLQQIPANTVKKIDIITVPTAKYVANGKGGIINIDTKNIGPKGVSATVNGLIGGAPWANLRAPYSNDELKDDRVNLGANFTYNLDRVSLHAGVNYSQKNVNGKRVGRARVLIDNQAEPFEYFHMNAEGERPEWYEYFSANVGVDFQVFEEDQLSVNYFYGDQTAGRAAYYIYNRFDDDVSGLNNGNDASDLDTFVYNPNIDNRYGEYHNLGVDYKATLSEKQTLKLSANYEDSDLSRELLNRDFDYNPITDQVTSGVTNLYGLSDDTPLEGYRTSVDYTLELDDASTLNAGIQAQSINIAGDFDFTSQGEPEVAITANLDNSIDLTRNVYGAYLDYEATRGKWSYVLGLRTELTDQELNVTNTNYLSLFAGRNQAQYRQNQLDWFPSVHVGYEIDKKQKIAVAASRRINRPSVIKLAPFLYRRHFEVYVVGDPLLKPEYLNNIELSYDTKLLGQTINLTGFYRGVENSVFRVNTVTTAVEDVNRVQPVRPILKQDVLIRSYTNAGDSQSIGGELNTNVGFGKFGKLFVGGSLYNYQIDGLVFGYNVNQNSTNWSAKTNWNIHITKEIKFNFDYSYTSSTVTSQGQNDDFQMANIAVNYSPKRIAGLDISARLLDVFQTNVQGLDTNAFNAQKQQIFYQETEYTRNGLIAELGITYTFNKKPKKKSKKFFADKHFK